MSIAALIDEGYVVYRPAPMRNVDCVSLRPIDAHARHIARIMPVIQVATANDVHEAESRRELTRVGQWLSMAAGLQFVKVDKLPHDRTEWMCGSAWRYHSA